MMPAPRLTQALGIVAEVREALTNAGLTQAHVTIDAAEVPSGARHGVVVVSPPSLDFETFTETVPTWELHVIAGPADNYLAAWSTIDTMIEALVTGHINLNRGEPGQYQGIRGEQLPAYTLKLNPVD